MNHETNQPIYKRPESNQITSHLKDPKLERKQPILINPEAKISPQTKYNRKHKEKLRRASDRSAARRFILNHATEEELQEIEEHIETRRLFI